MDSYIWRRGHVQGEITFKRDTEVEFRVACINGQFLVQHLIGSYEMQPFGAENSHPEHPFWWQFKMPVPVSYDGSESPAKFFVEKIFRNIRFEVEKKGKYLELYAVITIVSGMQYKVYLYTSHPEFEKGKTDWLIALFFYSNADTLTLVYQTLWEFLPVPSTEEEPTLTTGQ